MLGQKSGKLPQPQEQQTAAYPIPLSPTPSHLSIIYANLVTIRSPLAGDEKPRTSSTFLPQSSNYIIPTVYQILDLNTRGRAESNRPLQHGKLP